MGVMKRDDFGDELPFQIAYFIEDAVSMLGLVMRFNNQCTFVELDEMEEVGLQHACATLTSLFDVQFPGFEVDELSLPPHVMSVMSDLQKTALTILGQFRLLGPMSVETHHSRILHELDSIEIEELGIRRTAVSIIEPATIAAQIGAGQMIPHCGVHLVEHFDDDGYIEKFTFELRDSFLTVGVPVFKDVFRFSKIDDSDVIQLKRAVHTLLGWQLENIPSGGVSTQSPVGERISVGPLRGQQLKLSKAVDYIRAKGPICGAAIASHIDVDEKTFRKHYVPQLKERNVKNDGPGGDGYYLSEDTK
ncbi:MAG: hypothetical protein AABP62_16705 [Planctomycetota bacterium]